MSWMRECHVALAHRLTGQQMPGSLGNRLPEDHPAYQVADAAIAEVKPEESGTWSEMLNAHRKVFSVMRRIAREESDER